MASGQVRKIAVVGAGMAGAACAHALMRAGHAVHVFDKSRGPGGRLATRRVEWLDADGQARTTRFDHGAVGITARSAAFQAFLEEAVHAGCLAEWAPPLAKASGALDHGSRLFVPVSDMPALCRHLLQGAEATWSFAATELHRGALGWQLQADGERLDALFDGVVLALPPAQVAPLLSPHRLDWARHASVAPMQPCWTLMGITDDPQEPTGGAPGWSLARPATGPLAWVMRNDARPGRQPVAGQAHWVAHARAGWSRQHLDQPPAWVQLQLQGALAEFIGQPLNWQHGVVHRWRYALPQVASPAVAETCWWDAAQRLGVCGDFLGGTGVEGAWLSAQALAAAWRMAADAAVAPAAHAAA